MEKLLLAFTLSLCSLFIAAQSKLPPVDKSALDMSYYPSSYPVLKIQDKVTEPLVARVIFSRPSKNGRSIFGELLEYGKVWRLGANEATEIEFFQNVVIGGNNVKKGRYTMYCIPYPDKWTLIINKETDTWGSFKYDASRDILRVDAPVQRQTEVLEAFVIAFDKTPSGANLVIGWDNMRVNLPFSY